MEVVRSALSCGQHSRPLITGCLRHRIVYGAHRMLNCPCSLARCCHHIRGSMTTRRTTRSQTKALVEAPSQVRSLQGHHHVASTSITNPPDDIRACRTGLAQDDHDLLLQKRHLLRSLARAKQSAFTERAFQSTLVFAQYAAGTAVCISPEGLLC